ncbi:hypothetical protein C0989_004567 [Termitomyces sp. Mn162]|nr:hypothetical protein C0989_004567 [Termitomyces sp. Mn162]
MPGDRTCHMDYQWERLQLPVYGKQVSGLGLEGALDYGPDSNIFSALATLLCAIILTPDNLPAHLTSHSSNTLLLHTTLLFSNNPIPTLVNSSATNNFIDKFLAALTPQCLQCLLTPILLKLFDSKPTSVRDITYCVETTVTFANGQQQELQLLVTKLYLSTPIVLGFLWLCSINPHIDWLSLTLCLDWNNPTNSGLVPFNVSLPSKNSKSTTDQP